MEWKGMLVEETPVGQMQSTFVWGKTGRVSDSCRKCMCCKPLS